MPVDFIEFDVHRTRDGVLVVHHDGVLGRTCEGEGAIADQDWSVLKALKLHRTDGETLPTLDEILDILEKGAPALRLEIKYMVGGARYPGLEAEVLNVLRERQLLHRTTITAFDLAVLAEVAILAPGVPTIHLIREKEYAEGGARSWAMPRTPGMQAFVKSQSASSISKRAMWRFATRTASP